MQEQYHYDSLLEQPSHQQPHREIQSLQSNQSSIHSPIIIAAVAFSMISVIILGLFTAGTISFDSDSSDSDSSDSEIFNQQTEQPEYSGTGNSYTAEDAFSETTDSDDDGLISMRWQYAEDDLNWAFVVMKLSVGDNTYDCAPDASQECRIGQDGDDDSVWETDEFLILSESGTDIAGADGSTTIDIYVTYRGTAVSGDSSVTVA